MWLVHQLSLLVICMVDKAKLKNETKYVSLDTMRNSNALIRDNSSNGVSVFSWQLVSQQLR